MGKVNNNWLAHLALFGANLIYGINYTVAKDVMPDYIQAFGFILLRVIGASLLFWLFSAAIGKMESPKRKDVGRFILCGLFGVAANQLMFFKGLSLTHPINAAIIMTTNPILVLVMASFILNEAISRFKVIGILLGLGGAVFLILVRSDGSFGLSSETAFGDLLIFLNATCYGIYLVLVKPLMTKYPPIVVVRWTFTFGFLFVLPFGFSEFNAIDWQSMPEGIMWKAAFVVIGTTFFAYLFNVYALKSLSPSVVSTYIYLQPLLATLVALWLGSDEITWQKVLSAIFIFAGVYLVSNPRFNQLKSRSRA